METHREVSVCSLMLLGGVRSPGGWELVPCLSFSSCE